MSNNNLSRESKEQEEGEIVYRKKIVETDEYIKELMIYKTPPKPFLSEKKKYAC